MANVNPKVVGASLAAVITASGIAAVNLPQYEGWRLSAYGDPGNPRLATACAGVTRGIELGRKYTEADCESRTAQALIEHGMGAAKCLPNELPPLVRASFTDLAYNRGVAKFCASEPAARARAGDLRGACLSIPKDCPKCARLPGLKRRRDYEVCLCMKGVDPAYRCELPR